jgi:hypothetical protein
VLVAFFIVVAAGTAILGSLALTRAADPVVRAAGRFAPALAAAAFLSIRVVGLAATAWFLIVAGIAACFATALVLLERYAERPPSDWAVPLAARARARLTRAAR